MIRRLYLALFFILPFVVNAQISLLKDINPGITSSSSNASYLVTLSGNVYFAANDGVTGTELWKSNGTAAGTVRVKDINPGDNSGNPTNLTLVGSYIYFSANDGDNGSELWRTDGTEAGTIMVADISPGLNSSSPSNFIAIGTTAVYFSANDGTNGNEPWKSDVATKTTTMLLDIVSGITSSSPFRFVYASGTTAYFVATDAAGSELWMTDGASTTVRLSNLNTGGNSNPNYLTMLGGSVYFAADDGSTNGVELWKSSGGAPTLVKNINATASTGSSPFNLAAAGSYIFFGANDGVNGIELWRTDGTTGGTTMMTNLNAGAGSSLFSVIPIIAVGTSVYFYANANLGDGAELYRCTSTGVINIININPGSNGSGPNYLANINGILYLQATSDATGYEMVRVNGTTFTIYDIASGTGSSAPRQFTSIDGTNVLYTANNGTGTELFKWNGSTNAQVIDLITGSDGSSPTNFVYNGSNAVFFQASDGTGAEVWKTDGVDGTATHTFRLKDINTGGSGNPFSLTMVGSTLFFVAYDGIEYELYKSDGNLNNATKIDVNPGANGSAPYNLIARTSTELVFVAYHDTYGTELFKYNTTTSTLTPYDIYAGTAESYPESLTLVGTQIFFTALHPTWGQELYRFNGTSIFNVADIVPGATGSDPYELAAIGSTLYFTAYTAATGYELYTTTGSGATLVKEIAPGTASSSPNGFTTFGSFVYFQAADVTNGAEIWRTDGTAANTKLFKDAYAGTASSTPWGFTVFDNKLYFNARDAANGNEMWVTDGQADGNGLATNMTKLLKDINTGAAHGGFSAPVIVGTKMFMIGAESSGSKVWVTDGRECGTVAVTPYPGGATASALNLTQAPSSKLIFAMTLQGSGREPFMVDPALVTLPTNVAISAQPQPATVTMPASASFSVTATGTALTYQWQKAGVNIPDATAATYNIPATSDSDAGLYRVIVTGPCGQVTSTQVALTVNIVTPTAQPTGLVISNPTPTSLYLKFSAASGSPSSYLVIRKKGSAPTEVPTDGSFFTPGATFVNSTVVSAGPTTEGPDAGLDPTSEYFYAIFAFNGSGALIKYLPTSPLTGSAFTLAAEPTDQPTSLAFSNVDGTTLSGSFTAAAGASRYLVIRAAGAAPTSTPVDGQAYAAGETIGDGIVAYLGDTPSFTDSGLTPETHYYYKVYSAKGPGPTVNYYNTSPLQNDVTTLAIQPEAPTRLGFSNVTNNSFTVSYTAPAAPPAGYVVLRNPGTTLTGIPSDGTTYTLGQTVGDGRVAYVGANTTFDENLPLAQFTYSVFPYNGTGITINYRQATPLTGLIAPDNTAPVITDQTLAASPSGSGIKIVVSIDEPQTSVQAATVEYRSVSAPGTATNTAVMLLVSGKEYEFIVPANDIGDLGIEYTITATNTLSISSTKTGKSALTFTNQTIALGSFGSAVSDYRIVSVPLNLTSKSIAEVFGDDLGAYDGVNWRMYRHEDGVTTELSSSSTIEAGKGYWLIAKENKAIDTGPGTTVDVTSAAPFQLDLKEGWNQIGNPYNFNLVWNDVLTVSNLNLKLRLYVEGFFDGDKLAKYQGGFVMSNSVAKLTFPVKYNSAAGRTSGEPKRLTNAIDQGAWEVILNLKHGTTNNPFGGVGMNHKADPLFDEFDDFTLPRFLDFVELNHDKKFLNIAYTKDIVPTVANYTWEFTVESNSEGPTEITWDNSYFGISDKQLILWDEEESIPVNMRETGSYSFKLERLRKFKVFYGSPEYVKEKSSKDRILIHNISPNPSEGEVNFTFTVPGLDKSQVEVRVLNSLGQSIAPLFNGFLDAGHHQMSWSGRDNNGVKPSQGVYLVEVLSNGQRVARRVVLK
jgi:ELWxxDGT repeat protein